MAVPQRCAIGPCRTVQRLAATCWIISPVLALALLLTTVPAASAQTASDEKAPFAQRLPVPEFPGDLPWLNVTSPIRLHDVKGKFVLLDFWTYCCINCMHLLPELEKLEAAFPNTLVVIGVHTAKFQAEKNRANIEEAISRYHIAHPVINDANRQLWNQFGVRAWPSLLLIDPEGMAVWAHSGEVKAEVIASIIRRASPYYRRKGLLNETPVSFAPAAQLTKTKPLYFPGKLVADEASRRLFIADSSHHRIVITTLDGRALATIGTGRVGRQDGSFDEASFRLPQGLALDGQRLYVADTGNHLLRVADLATQQVSTIAGTGRQRTGAAVAMSSSPRTTDLASPWACLVHGDWLYVAMAGCHQIWRLSLDHRRMGPYAGNGREDIVDGLLLPRRPYEQRPDGAGGATTAVPFSSFAQPSGLATDGQWLYVADSEGSSIRRVPLTNNGLVETVVGTSQLPQARLFTFGDRDGERPQVLLQHPLGVAWYENRLFVADTYNNKLKVIDPKTGRTTTLAGSGEAGLSDDPATFDEPGGLSVAEGKLYVADTNNHAIRVVDPMTGDTTTLSLTGVEPPRPAGNEPTRE